MREAARKHFSQFFEEDCVSRPGLDGLFFNRISGESCGLLEAKFSFEELCQSLKSCDGNKAPCLDRFNMNFFKSFWLLLKVDIMEIFNEMHSSGKFVKSLNSTFILFL